MQHEPVQVIATPRAEGRRLALNWCVGPAALVASSYCTATRLCEASRSRAIQPLSGGGERRRFVRSSMSYVPCLDIIVKFRISPSVATCTSPQLITYGFTRVTSSSGVWHGVASLFLLYCSRIVALYLPCLSVLHAVTCVL